MRVLRHLVWSVLGSLLLVGVAPAAVQADEAHARHGAHCPIRQRARGTNTAPNPPLQRYFDSDWRLGPRGLPRSGPIGRMLRRYWRLDSTSQYWFLGCYWQTNPVSAKSGWWYPDHNGFLLVHGKPVEQPRTLRAGQLVDLFGSGFGNFLAPAGTPYDRRAIPPSNLNTYDVTHPFGYHLYRVVKAFTVEAGPIRPWFGQPGLGLQYMTAAAIPALVTAGNLLALN